MCYNTICAKNRAKVNIWVWRRLVARYLGVVEAAGSNPVTQTRLNGRWKISRFSFIIKLFPHFSGADFLLFLLLKMRRKMIENEVGT